ncbi:hypothetical protein ACTWUW_001005 [Campylobacter jejuni]|nr:hypothetical protein [Campylobacter jejuni]
MQKMNSGKSVGISAKLTLWVGILVVLILAIQVPLVTLMPKITHMNY